MPLMRAPGRINLIGEHTDYNDGFVMPVAINLEMVCRFEERGDDIVKLLSEGFGSATFHIGDDKRDGRWSDYVKGVALYLSEGYDLIGWEGHMESSIPTGSGLSSSAAIEILSAGIMQQVSSLDISPLELVEICRKAENEFVGVRCGIMDQFAVAFGRRGQSIFLDCRSLRHEFVPLPDDIMIFVVDTGIRRELSKSGYEKRRAECEKASAILGKSLRDADLDEVLDLPHPLDKRSRHVVEENDRVLAAREALRGNDLEKFGDLMFQSHHSLKNLYEVSSPELNRAVWAAKEAGALGARMTGAGFGGCAIAIVQRENAEAVKGVLEDEFLVYECETADGASLER